MGCLVGAVVGFGAGVGGVVGGEQEHSPPAILQYAAHHAPKKAAWSSAKRATISDVEAWPSIARSLGKTAVPA